MNTKQLKKETLVSAYDRLNKLTTLQFLKLLCKEVDARQLKLSEVNAGNNIIITFDEEGNPVINASGEVSVEWNEILNKPLFKAIATSGDYNDIVTNKPTINANTLVGNKTGEQLGLVDISALDTKVTALGYIKGVSFSEITGSVNDNVSLANALLQKENKLDLDNDVRTLGYIKGITTSDIEELVEGSTFISFDVNPTTEKLTITFDFTNIDEFIEYASGQEVVASWTSDAKPKLKLNLRQDLTNKINNSLQLPTTHTEETLVGVDTAGAQEKVNIGAGLSLVNGVLTNTQAGTDIHLYEHNLKLTYGQIVILLSLVTNNNTPITTNQLLYNVLGATETHLSNGYNLEGAKTIIGVGTLGEATQGIVVYYNDGTSIGTPFTPIYNDYVRQIV